VLTYWPDVASDFSVFHRIGDIENCGLSAPQFFGFAYRLEVYGGAVALAAVKARAHERAPSGAHEEISFDDWVDANPALVIQAANRMGGGGHA
jgi:hypothetical protein